jgi:choline dehydrogenase
MNFVWAPDNEWDYIAELTGDDTWGHEYMRRHLMALENCTYVPHGTPGHGYDGYLEVRQISTSIKLSADMVLRCAVQYDGSNDYDGHHLR